MLEERTTKNKEKRQRKGGKEKQFCTNVTFIPSLYPMLLVDFIPTQWYHYDLPHWIILLWSALSLISSWTFSSCHSVNLLFIAFSPFPIASLQLFSTIRLIWWWVQIVLILSLSLPLPLRSLVRRNGLMGNQWKQSWRQQFFTCCRCCTDRARVLQSSNAQICVQGWWIRRQVWRNNIYLHGLLGWA